MKRAARYSLVISMVIALCCGCKEKQDVYEYEVQVEKEPQRYPELTDAVKKLIESGKDINVPQEFCDPNTYLGKEINRLIRDQKCTPLHIAARCGTLESVRLLLDHGANVESRDLSEGTPLHDAVWRAFPDTCKLLIESGAQVNAKDMSGDTPIFMVVPARQRIWNISNALEICSLLVNAGAEINIQNDISYTPLHRYVTTPHPEIVEFLIKHGAKVDATTDDERNTPLHTAMLGGEIEILKLLLDNGADINARKKFGKTPLSEAKYFMKNGYTTEARQKEIIKYLKSRGAVE